MTDGMLTLKKDSATSRVEVGTEHPIERMQQCLRKASELERLATELDFNILESEKAISIAEQNYNKCASTISSNLNQSLETIKNAHQYNLNRANQEFNRIGSGIHMALNSGNLPPPIIDHKLVISESTEDLEKEFISVNQVAVRMRQDISKNKNEDSKQGKDSSVDISAPCGIGCVGIILLCVFESALGNAGFYLFFGIIGTIILFYFVDEMMKSIKRDSTHKHLKRIADLLLSKAKFECDQAISRTTQDFNSKEKSVNEQSTTELQTAKKQRDWMVTSIRNACKTRKSDLLSQMARDYQTLTKEILVLNDGIVSGSSSDAAWTTWQPAQQRASCLRIGIAHPEMPRFMHHMPGAPQIVIPALVNYEAGKGILIKCSSVNNAAQQLVSNVIMRLLATVPPAGVRFTFVDPIQLGGNVAEFMKLDQYEANLIGGKSWSDTRDIEQALLEVTEYMETVIQKYLRDDIKTIADYNLKAWVKEAYRVVVVFDFPSNFTEISAKRLVSIARNGPRCGVFPLVVVDDTKPLPYGFNLSDLEQFALVLHSAESNVAN